MTWVIVFLTVNEKVHNKIIVEIFRQHLHVYYMLFQTLFVVFIHDIKMFNIIMMVMCNDILTL